MFMDAMDAPLHMQLVIEVKRANVGVGVQVLILSF
jgi:hypothetical protein